MRSHHSSRHGRNARPGSPLRARAQLALLVPLAGAEGRLEQVERGTLRFHAHGGQRVVVLIALQLPRLEGAGDSVSAAESVRQSQCRRVSAAESVPQSQCRRVSAAAGMPAAGWVPHARAGPAASRTGTAPSACLPRACRRAAADTQTGSSPSLHSVAHRRSPRAAGTAEAPAPPRPGQPRCSRGQRQEACTAPGPARRCRCAAHARHDAGPSPMRMCKSCP